MRVTSAATLLFVSMMVTHLPATQGPAPESAARPPAHGRLVVFLYVAAPLAASDRDAGLALADTLLATAGVAVDWRVCVPSDACPPNAVPSHRVTLILTSSVRANCGQASLGLTGPGATVLISVPCVEEAARAISRKQTARAHPSLATIASSQLLGAVVAHEIGHVLGLKHAARGIMRARIGIDDVLALQQGRLAFDAIQGGRMRVAAAIDLEVTRAVSR